MSVPSVTACVPYYGGKRYIRRAVTSLLAQTHRDLQVVVVNDGDRDPPWDQLMDLHDPRLVLFNLSRNHGGPFFANAVVADAAGSPWFLVQEQDDWSTPNRLERLMKLASDRSADVAVSGQYFHRQLADGSSTPVGPRWRHTGHAVCPACTGSTRCMRCFVDMALTSSYQYRAPHTALFRVELLRRVGGYYAGMHLHYDSLLMNVLLMTGTLAHTGDALYHRLLRPDSITNAKTTGFGSDASKREHGQVLELYARFFGEYQRYIRGEMDSEGLADSIRACCQSQVSAVERRELADEVARLRTHLEVCRAAARRARSQSRSGAAVVSRYKHTSQRLTP
jgi:glycosyltransferase involved in cell wall biosynthesis